MHILEGKEEKMRGFKSCSSQLKLLQFKLILILWLCTMHMVDCLNFTDRHHSTNQVRLDDSIVRLLVSVHDGT